jgi:hypothetical protein
MFFTVLDHVGLLAPLLVIFVTPYNKSVIDSLSNFIETTGLLFLLGIHRCVLLSLLWILSLLIHWISIHKVRLIAHMSAPSSSHHSKHIIIFLIVFRRKHESNLAVQLYVANRAFVALDNAVSTR